MITHNHSQPNLQQTRVRIGYNSGNPYYLYTVSGGYDYTWNQGWLIVWYQGWPFQVYWPEWEGWGC